MALPLVGAVGVAVLVAQVSPLPGALASSLPSTGPSHVSRSAKKALPPLTNIHTTQKKGAGQPHLAPATHTSTASTSARSRPATTPAVPPAARPKTHTVTPAIAPQSAPATAAPSASSGAVAPATASGSVPAMIRRVFGPYAGQALNIARCESGFNPAATNRSSGAAGIFQFLRSTWRGTAYARYSPYNAWANINAAHQVFVRDGYSWREWVCRA